MFRFYVEDSGKQPHDSPALVLGGWMARVDDWERFSDAWEISVGADNPKPLKYHKGFRYFRHHDAVKQEACFAGFTAQEAWEKTVNLSWLLTGLVPRVGGFAVVVPHDQHKQFVKDMAVIRRAGRVRPEQKNPFYIAFSHLVPSITALHYHAGFRDRIDFIFDGDKTDKPLRDGIRAFDNMREDFKDQIWYPLMGSICPGDDKELAPLQAADMFAGQVRRATVEGAPQPILNLWGANRVKMLFEVIGKAKLEKWSSSFNESIATDILTAIKEESEGRSPPRVMSKRREKKKRKGDESA